VSLTAHEARAVGLDLWEASSQFTKTLVSPEAGLAGGLLIGMVARSRALLRAAYALADDGYELEAMLQVRALNEYAITVKWLCLDADYHALLIGIDDLKARLRIDREVTALGGEQILTPESKARDEAKLAELRAECGERPAELPRLIKRAEAAGMALYYSLAYRADSQAAAHPSLWAVEQFAEAAPDGPGLVVHDRVAPGRTTTSPYKGAVVPFALVLDTFAEAAPDEALQKAVASITGRVAGGVSGWV
jgi:uncharacterized protein DUF5677